MTKFEEDYSNFQDQTSLELFTKLKKYPRSDEWTTKWSRKFLAGKIMSVEEPLIDEAEFDAALAMDSYEVFRDIIKTIPRESLFTIHRINKLKSVVTDRSEISGKDHDRAVADLKEIVGLDDKYLGICVVKTPEDSREIGTESMGKVFSLHSIGKVFTGILIAEMIARGIILETELTSAGLQLDDDVRRVLPETVQMKIGEVSLHQVMTHQASLGDYLEKYVFEELNNLVESGRIDEIPILREPQDFLRYASDKVEDNNYSNLGILLAGLAAQHYYNRDRTLEDQKSYNEILHELVLEPAGLKNFSATPPVDGLFSDENKMQPFICGSPAGGYWTNAKDMQKFADHICGRMEDENFRDAVTKYGQEFYDESDQTIRHAGDLPKTSTWFSVHIPSKTSCVIAKNGDFAGMIGHQVSMVIAAEQERQHSAAPSSSPSPEYSAALRSGVAALESEKKPLYIFVGENHADFSYTNLCGKLLESCKAKHLRASLCQEIPSRVDDMREKKYIEYGDAKYLPDDWELRATTLQSDPAFVNGFHDRGRVAKEFFEPYRSQGKSINDIIDYWKDHVSSDLLEAEIKKAKDAGVDFDMVETDPDKIAQMGDEKGDGKSEYNENFFKFVGSGFNWNLCLSDPEISSDMAERIGVESKGRDVVIVCTGSAHSDNVAKKLDLAPQEMLIISNESEMLDVLRFDVDAVSFEVSVPDAAEEKLAEKQASKAAQSLAR